MWRRLPVLPVLACLAMAGVRLGDALRPVPDPADQAPLYRPEDLLSPRGVSLPEAPTVNLTEGDVTGLVYTMGDDSTFLAYQGIPFGEPPTGPLRFKVGTGRDFMDGRIALPAQLTANDDAGIVAQYVR